MPAIQLQNIDDFIVANLPFYEKNEWEDISTPLQKYYYAQRLFSKAKPEEMEGALVKWDVQYDYDDTFAVTGLHDPDTTSRKDTLTQGSMFWSFVKANYSYDLREDQFNGAPVRILKWLDVKEHGLYNTFFSGMEKLMFGTGPTSPTQVKPPPASLLWWIQPYNSAALTAAGITNTITGSVTSDFLGLDPPGFSSVGTGGISATQYAGWRNRCGAYNVFTEDDAVDTIIECMDKCEFTPAQAYAELSPTTKADWELLTTYSRLKIARKISASQNDNMKGNIDKWKDTVIIRGVPMNWVPAWNNQSFGVAQTNGPVLGVNWKTWKFMTKSSLNMLKSPPERDMYNHLGRWRHLDHCCQILCQNRRGNFIVTSNSTVTESN
jgi:hypothetical protein